MAPARSSNHILNVLVGECCGTLDTMVPVKGQTQVHVVLPNARFDVRQCSLVLSFFGNGRIGPCAVCLVRTPNALGKIDPLPQQYHELADPSQPLTPAGRAEFSNFAKSFPICECTPTERLLRSSHLCCIL